MKTSELITLLGTKNQSADVEGIVVDAGGKLVFVNAGPHAKTMARVLKGFGAPPDPNPILKALELADEALEHSAPPWA